MPIGYDDYEAYASVALHETGHQLFSQQPPTFAYFIEETMLESSSPTRMPAYRWLDEALATATANGWVYRQLAEMLDTGSWYSNRIIEDYARAIYPRVEEYIETGRTIDAEFLHYALTQFEATFPHATTDPEALFPFYSLVTDAGDTMNELLTPFYQRYRLRGTMATNGFNDESLQSALSVPGFTIVLLTDPNS